MHLTGRGEDRLPQALSESDGRSGMKEYRLTILFAFVGSFTAGIATLMVHRSTGDMTTTVTTRGLLTGFLAFVLAADVIITRPNPRQRDRQMEAAKLEYLQESRRRIVAVEEGSARTSRSCTGRSRTRSSC